MDRGNSKEEQPRIEDEEAGLRSSNGEVDVDKIIQLIESKLLESDNLISESAGGIQSSSSCCIFRVPQEYLPDSEVKTRPHEPRTVSIGPYHHGKPHLKEMEKHKVRFLNRLINRTVEKNGMGIEQYVKAVKELEPVARASYSEDTTTFKEDDFVAMLVLDGCFVVEMFLAYSDEVPLEADDPFRSMTRLQFSLHHDFLCLENQIPYLVLQKLFELTQMGSDSSPGESHRLLPLTALRFFNRSRDLGKSANMICMEWVPVHLLDLVRKSYFPPPVESKHHSAMEESQWQSVMALQAETKQNGAAEESRLKCFPRTDWDCKPGSLSKIQSITKLERAGIKLKLNSSMKRSFLQVEFKRGMITMPQLNLDNRMCGLLVNCVAFEQLYGREEKSMSEYVAFLDCLIDAEEDVTPLCEASIVRHQSHLFSHPQVAAFVNQLGKAAVCDAAGGYLRDVFVRVNNHFDKHYNDPWHVLIADVAQSHFKRYFSSPWKLTSVCAAVILLLLTVTQTIFTIMDYFKKD